MREGWEYKKLGELVQVLNGYAFKSALYEGQGIRVLRITNVQKGKIVDDDPKYYPLSLTDEIRNFLLKESDLLMSLTGNVGRVGLLTKEMLPAALNQRVACLRILSDCLNLGFLFHYLNSDKFEQDAIISAKGIAQKNMSTEWLKDYQLPLPPTSVQQSIVSELDKINELIRLKKEQLKDYDNLAQSIFYEMFGDPVVNEKGWEVKKLGTCISVIGGYAFKSDNFQNEGIPVLRIGNINAGVFRLTNMVFWPKDERLTRYIIKPGDLVMSLTGTVGKNDYGNVCVIDNSYPLYYLNQRNAKLQLSNAINRYYLAYILRNNNIKSILTGINRGVRQANIANKDIEGLIIPLPPLPLQQLFASRITQIEVQKAEVQRAFKDLETLLASRMQYWFE